MLLNMLLVQANSTHQRFRVRKKHNPSFVSFSLCNFTHFPFSLHQWNLFLTGHTQEVGRSIPQYQYYRYYVLFWRSILASIGSIPVYQYELNYDAALQKQSAKLGLLLGLWLNAESEGPHCCTVIQFNSYFKHMLKGSVFLFSMLGSCLFEPSFYKVCNSYIFTR